MQQQSLQLCRTTQITQHFQKLKQALALLSRHPYVPSEVSNLLDFHAIIESDSVESCLENGAWLNEVQHIAYQYQRSTHTRRLLFSDGILCDIHLHSPNSLSNKQAQHWHIHWQKQDFQIPAYPTPHLPPLETQTEWLLGELLTHLALGLRYYANGEKLAAFQCIQQRALNHLLTLSLITDNPEQDLNPSSFWEHQFSALSSPISQFAPGYDASPEAAQAIIDQLGMQYNINHFIKDQILNLIASCLKPHERPL